MGNLYNEKSIESLSPLEFTRLRPGVYVGSTQYSTQLLIEIVGNVIDEYKAGHGDKVIIIIREDNSITVIDEGQGFLVNSVREDGKTILEAAFSVLNTSGKYSDDGVYEGVALGLNGIGSKLATFLSHWLEVTTYRDGKFEKIRFNEGVFENREVGKSDSHSGTTVTWLPSEEFFDNPEVDYTVINNLMQVLSCLCPGLVIELDIKGKKTSFFSKNGLNDLVNASIKDKEIIKNRFSANFSQDKYKLDMVMTYTDSYHSTIIPYVNTGLTDSGPHLTQIKTILTKEMNKFFRDRGYLKEKDANLTGEDIQEGVFIVFNITAPGVSYDAQTKSRVVKLDMKPFTQTLSEELQYWFSANEKDIKAIADKSLSARKAREAAKKARDTARGLEKKKESGLKGKMQLSKKFIDCKNKNPQDRNLLLVEGVSAATSAVEARDTKRDAIYMLRGKTVSPLKTSIEKILANQEMSDIIKVIGAGFGSSFDVSKVRFGKIVITSDQDSDGFDIELLLMTFFYTYMRPLVEAGLLYRAVTPLYIIRYKGKEDYCFTEKELDEWKQAHPGIKYDLLRAKG